MAAKTANDLLTQLLSLTGAGGSVAALQQMKWCISLGEQRLRTLNLPLLTSDPYDLNSVGIADSNGAIKVPGDMREPIQFFKNGTQFSAVVLCSGTIGQNTITLSQAPVQSLAPGMSVVGNGIAPGTKVVSYSNLIATVSANNLSTFTSTLTFRSDPSIANGGPFVVYNRIGPKQGITKSLIYQAFPYYSPSNIYATAGTFWEINGKYHFNPKLSGGDLINLYYYKAVPKLFNETGTTTILSATATISNVVLGGNYWTATITVPASSPLSKLEIRDTVGATAGTGGLNTTEAEVIEIINATSFKVKKPNDGSSITAGNITNLYINNIVKTNLLLQNFYEGLLFSSLIDYYSFNNNVENQTKYERLLAASTSIVDEQNTKGIFSGGDTTFTSPYLPRGRNKRIRTVR